jgi:lipopolysaccharide biosynthesis protein
MDLLAQLEHNLRPGPDYEEDRDEIALPTPLPVRLIAYYLPQFHPIPENDQWWGKGFTEWTNVTKALPRFVGHIQPRLPGELGFYDLRLTETVRQQAALARRHGISGFCFHYYWFAGRRLLEKPLQLLLSQPDIDLPFCVNWANESWTRRWDSSEQHVLMGQRHSAEDDIAFAAALEPALRDHRYIRIDGRPLLMIYRPGLLPDAAATVTRWRQYFISRGIGNPFMVMPQAFGNDDPGVYGMDAAAGFPPHKFGWDLPSIAADLHLLDRHFRGTVVSYASMARAAMTPRSEQYRVFPGVCPGWDNEARRPASGLTFSGSSPRLYGVWLEHAGRMALQAPNYDERIVFINAWNEWAEGAHLEPDLYYGYAYLRETARVLNQLARPGGTEPLLAAAPANQFASHTDRRPAGTIARIIRRARFKGAGAAEYLANTLRPL